MSQLPVFLRGGRKSVEITQGYAQMIGPHAVHREPPIASRLDLIERRLGDYGRIAGY